MKAQRIVLTLLSLVVVSSEARAASSFQLTPPIVALLQDDEASDDAADGDVVDGEATEREGAPAASQPEIAVGGEQVGEAVGGATGFVFPTGFYMSADLGGFMRFGGYGDSRDANTGCFRCVPKLTSNLQPWIGINVGYDIIKNFGVEMTIGNGFIGEAAPIGYFAATDAPPPGNVQMDSPENSAITMLTVALTGSWYFLDRLALQGKGFVGGAILSPEPDPSKYNLVNGLACGASPWTPKAGDCDTEFGSDFGIAFGVGMGLRYATLLTDVIIGFDVNAYGVISPNVATAHTGGIRFGGAGSSTYIPPPIGLGVALPIIPAMSFAPVIKYVF